MQLNENVSQAEIDKFNEIAHRWWDIKGDMGMLHTINPLRLQFILDQAQGVQGKKVLDVGCGGGILTESLAKSGAQTMGIDLAEVSLNVAKKHAIDHSLDIEYRVEKIENLVHSHPEQFDVIACLEMLEHVPDPERIIWACSKLLKPGGHAFFSTINRTFKSWLFAIIGGEYILKLLPKGTHTYSMLIRPEEIRHWASKNNLDFKRLSSFMYNPIFKSFKVKDKTDVNYITHFVKK